MAFFAVFFVDDKAIYPYRVQANDTGKAVERAKPLYLAEHGNRGASWSISRVMNLTPKQRGGLFFPRIDGAVVSDDGWPTREAAVGAALAFLEERSAR